MMPQETYDAVIVGGGLMGASAASALASDGKKILLLEAQEKHHTHGSSHGHSRITRVLNEGAKAFSQTAAESLAEMKKMEAGGEKILRPAPAVFVAEKGSDEHKLLAESMRNTGNPVIEISPSETWNRYGIRIKDNQIAIIDQGAATFNPYMVLDKLYHNIEAKGGQIRFNTPVAFWKSGRKGISVTAQDGTVAHADHLVLAPGAWTPEILRAGNGEKRVIEALADAMKLDRIPLFFFEYPANMPDIIPIFDEGRAMYGMPEMDGSGKKFFKVVFHYCGQDFTRPEQIERRVSEEEKKEAASYVKQITGQDLDVKKAFVCIYPTDRRSELPVVGRLPGSPNVFLASFASGLGAKHAIALGKAVSHMIQGKTLSCDLSEFDPLRISARRYRGLHREEAGMRL